MVKQVVLTNYKRIYGIDEKDETLNSLVQQNEKTVTYTKEFASWL